MAEYRNKANKSLLCVKTALPKCVFKNKPLREGAVPWFVHDTCFKKQTVNLPVNEGPLSCTFQVIYSHLFTQLPSTEPRAFMTDTAKFLKLEFGENTGKAAVKFCGHLRNYTFAPINFSTS